ncbi:hypothetical protein COCCADRAFT_82120, partial [Bipolaris zeicola 26-R-13]
LGYDTRHHGHPRNGISYHNPPLGTGCGTCRRSQLHTYKLSPWNVCAVCVRGIDVDVARAIWLQASGYCW